MYVSSEDAPYVVAGAGGGGGAYDRGDRVQGPSGGNGCLDAAGAHGNKRFQSLGTGGGSTTRFGTYSEDEFSDADHVVGTGGGGYRGGIAGGQVERNAQFAGGGGGLSYFDNTTVVLFLSECGRWNSSLESNAGGKTQVYYPGNRVGQGSTSSISGGVLNWPPHFAARDPATHPLMPGGDGYAVVAALV